MTTHQEDKQKPKSTLNMAGVHYKTRTLSSVMSDPQYRQLIVAGF